MMISTQQIESQTLQQINRLVSASSPSDALESIYTLTSTIQQAIHDSNKSNNDSSSPSSPSKSSSSTSSFETVLSILTESKEFLKSICILLSESKLQSSTSGNKRMLDVEEGDVAVLSFLNTILDYYKKLKDFQLPSSSSSSQQQLKWQQPNSPSNKTSNQFKLLAKLMGKFEEEEYHQSLSLIHSLLDIISIQDSTMDTMTTNGKSKTTSSSSSSSTLYKQSTTLSILSTLLKIIPTPTVTNILQTPHGLNRIIDLFKNNNNNSNYANNNNNNTTNDDDDEKIILRNESIILAIELVKVNPGISKFMIFEDVYDSIMNIASSEYRAYLASRQSNIGRRGKNNESSLVAKTNGASNTTAVTNGNLIIVKDCLELCIEMTKQESKMGSETFLSNNMTCQILTMLLDLRNGIYYREYNLCLQDYFFIQEEERKGNSSNGGGSNGSGSGGNDHSSFERGISISNSEDGLDDILLDSSSVGSSNRKGGNTTIQNQNGQDEKKHNPIPYTTDEESEIISYALTLFQTLIQGGDEDFIDESKNDIMSLKKSSSRDSTTSPSKHPSNSVSTRIQSIISSKNTNRLSMLLFDMALYTLPPPNSPIEFYVSSVPSMEIQCQALSVMADLGKIAKKISSEEGKDDLLDQILNCPSMYLKEVGCLERVMYLICTGGISFVLDDDDDNNDKKKKGVGMKVDNTFLSPKATAAVNAAKKVSMHSLGLLRNILTSHEAKIMVMQAFSPPVNDMDVVEPPNESKQDQPPQVEISVIQKLVNTLGENLHLLNDQNFSKDLKAIDKERMHINIIGAAGALGVFFTNGAGDTSREVLLRLPLPPPPPILKKMNGAQADDLNETAATPSLVECIMTYLELGTRSSTGSSGSFSNSSIPEMSMDVTFALLRLLTEWIPETPNVITAVLSSPNSVSLGFLLQQKSNKALSAESTQVLQAMTGVLLGLCMESMDSEDDVGGWSTSSIMNLINVGIGIGKFTQLLEGLKRIIAEGEVEAMKTSVGPWMCCRMERTSILQWYSNSVNIVRRKVVQELSAGNNDENDESDNDHDGITDTEKKTVKSLSKLVAHQNSEIEALRQELAESKDKMTSQALEMNLLTRRIESNPNQVDDLLDDYSSKILLLEIQAKNLKEEISKNNFKHQAAMKQHNDELSQLKQELDNSQSKTKQVLKDKDALKDEMKQLSFAYSNLETEYNRVTSNSSGQAIGDRTTESSNTQNPDNQVLQSENLKLKNDIRSANDWMSKAVKKMDELTKRNTALEAEATRLSNGHAQSGIFTENLTKEADQMKRQLVEITNERNGLKVNIQDYQVEISKLQHSQQELEIIQAHSTDLKTQLNQKETELEDQKKLSSGTIDELQKQLSAKDVEILNMKQLIQEENQNDSKLQQEHSKLTTAYKAAQEWMTNAVKLNDKLKQQVEEMKQENSSLRSNVDSARNQNESNSTSLQNEVSSLKKQLEVAIESEKALQDKLKTLENLRNDKSLDTKALQDQIEDMIQQNKILEGFKTKAEDLETEISQMIVEKNKASESERRLNEKLEESTQCQDRLYKEISELKENLEASKTTNFESEVLREEMSNLKNELDNERIKHVSEVGVLEKTLEECKEKNEQLQKDLNVMSNQSNVSSVEREEQNALHVQLQSEVEILRKENEELRVEKEEHVASIEELHARLTEFQTWTETAQESFAEVDIERQTLQEELEQMKFNEEKMSGEKLEAEKRIKQLTEETEFLKRKQEGDKNEEEQLKSEILSLQVEIGNLDGKNRALSEDNKVLEKKNADLTSKADLLDEVEESLFEKENEVTMLQNELASEKDKIEDLELKVTELKGKEQGKIEDLESTIREKETQLIHQEAEAREAISKWEQRCESIGAEIKSSQEERDEVERSFLKLEAEIELYHVSIEELNNTLETERSEKVALAEQREKAEDAYKNHIVELETAIQEHVEAIQQYESQLDERDEALVHAGAQIDALNKAIVDNAKESEDVVSKWQENSKQLEESIAELEAIIDNQDNDANAAIAEWEARCNSYSEQMIQYEHLKASMLDLEKTLSIKEEELVEAKDASARLSSELEDRNLALVRLQSELQAVKGSLNVEREQRDDNISEVQTLNSEKADILEQLKREKSQLKKTMQEMEIEKSNAEELGAKLTEAERVIDDLKASSKKNDEDRMAIEEVYEQEKQDFLSQINALEEDKRYLEESTEIDKSEANEMRLIIGQLENELKEANDMLQSHLTDEVTARATEMATNALRAQLKESREKQSYEHEAFLNEKEGRQIAEKEVQKLKADLALLLEAENISGSSDKRMQQLTSKAAGEVLERQRGEIDALTKSLEQLMQELQSCQSKERAAEERAANSRLHAAACEQELLGAKSDVSLLKDSIERLKIDESEMRTKLETRVKSLEDERENIMVSLGSEIRNLKAEISQDQMERDRLVHALNESEKANSALVYSTSVEHGDNNSSLELELSKLRLEKAQLLAAVQENGSKFEQRIRSAFSEGNEQKSSEKELIEAAERSLSGLQKKYEETAAQLEVANASNADLLSRMKETNMSELKNDLYRFETEVHKLQSTNKELESKLVKSEQESKSINAKLEEKCRLAEAKIIDLERQERKDAALAAEVARLREEAKESADYNATSNSESKESSVGVDEMHDIVLELKQTVRDERQVYQDLLSEHEDLLALLAQQDLEKSSLQYALVKSAGEEAVENAFIQAEKQSVQQFGKYIKLK